MRRREQLHLMLASPFSSFLKILTKSEAAHLFCNHEGKTNILDILERSTLM